MQVDKSLLNAFVVDGGGDVVGVGLDGVVSIAHRHTNATVFEHLDVVAAVAEGDAFGSVDAEMA